MNFPMCTGFTKNPEIPRLSAVSFVSVSPLADTTITGKLAVGAKVKIEYKMIATKITVQ